jgi:hypothetical protein
MQAQQSSVIRHGILPLGIVLATLIVQFLARAACNWTTSVACTTGGVACYVADPNCDNSTNYAGVVTDPGLRSVIAGVSKQHPNGYTSYSQTTPCEYTCTLTTPDCVGQYPNLIGQGATNVVVCGNSCVYGD